MAFDRDAFDRMVARGRSFNLDLFHTGGSCTALGRMGDEGSRVHHLLVTDSEDPCVPLDLDAPATVDWYDVEGDVILQVTFPNFGEAVEALAHGPDTIPSDLLPAGEVPTWTADEFWNAERYQGGR